MPNKDLDNKRLIYACVFFALVIFISAFCWWIFSSWVGFLIPSFIIYIIQWVHDAIKLSDFYPPLVRPLCKYLKSKIRAKWYAKQRQNIEIEQPKLITLSEWLVTDMINAKFGDYSSCHSKEHYELLMCQYADSKADDDLVSYKLLMKEKIAIQSMAIAIKFNIEILKDRWSNSAADFIRKLDYPVLPQPLTRESCPDIVRFLTAFLIGQNLKLKDIDDSISKLFSTSGTAITTKDQYTQHIEDLLVSMADVQAGAVYVLEGMKVSKLAALERARNKHIKSQQEQIRKMKTGGKN